MKKMGCLGGLHYIRSSWEDDEEKPYFSSAMDIFNIEFQKHIVHIYTIAPSNIDFVIRGSIKTNGKKLFRSENALTQDSINMSCTFKHKEEVMRSSRVNSVHSSAEAKRIFSLFKKIITAEAKRIDVPSVGGGTFKAWLMPEAIEYLKDGYTFG